ncbi:MAG TPA: hypothetical protein VNT54_12870 [Solirubrobacteraceae bacterium]|nr:hypothetical protein [Solirubrobacteraceae bacterium]
MNPARSARALALALFLVLLVGVTVVAASPAGDDPGITPADVLAAQRVATERQAWELRLQSPDMRAERAQRRTAYRGISDAEAVDRARRDFPQLMGAPLFPGAQFRAAAEVEYLGDRVARVRQPGAEQASLAISGLPLRVPGADGRRAPLDLSLESSAGGFRPRSPLVDARFGARSGDGFAVGDDAIELTLADAEDRRAEQVGERLFYASVQRDTDLVAFPTATGIEVVTMLRSVDSPERHEFDLDLPAGATARKGGGRDIEVARGDDLLGRIVAPFALDAQGQTVDFELSLVDGRVRIDVPHRERDYAYPIAVDPIADSYWPWYYNASTDFKGWEPERRGPTATSTSGIYGPGLYGKLPAGGAFQPYDYGRFRWQAPGNSYITAVNLGYVYVFTNSDGSAGPLGFAGIWDTNRGTYANMPSNPWYRADTAGNYYGRQLSDGGPGDRGNQALFGILSQTGGTRGPEALAYLGGAIVYIEDDQWPQLDALTHSTPDVTTGWHQTGTDTVQITAHDDVIGLFSYDLTVPQAAAPNLPVHHAGRIKNGEAQCDGTHRLPCRQSDRVTLPSYSLDSIPEGINTVNATIKDPLDHRTYTAWGVRVDRTEPLLDIDGTLVAANEQVVHGSPWDVAITANDIGPEGAAVAGIEQIEVRLNGTVVHDETPACTPECPASRSASWSFNPTQDGEYTVEVIARDAAGNEESETVVIVVAHATAKPPQSISLDDGGLRIRGGAPGDLAGQSIATVGDLNLDGFDDYIVGAPGVDAGRGAAYLVLGAAGGSEVTLSGAESSRHIRLLGARPGDRAGYAVAAAGDVNADGYPDLLVGAPGPTTAVEATGSVYVVFGSEVPQPVDLANLGAHGFEIRGPAVVALGALDDARLRFGAALATRQLGDFSVDGDVNGDGADDIVIGGRDPSLSRPADAGVVYVIFGKADTATIDLGPTAGDPGTHGFRVFGAAAAHEAGADVALPGDLNGDDRAEVLLVAPGANAVGRASAGTSYVVFGKSDTSTVELDNLGQQGYAITGASGDALATVAGPGDIDGDGAPDLLLGGRGAWVVYGKATAEAVDLAASFAGYRITPPTGTGYERADVAGVGDVDADRSPDTAVSFPAAGLGAGETYVLYGQPKGGSVDLANLPGHRGSRAMGASGSASGTSTTGADSGSDERPAYAVAAPRADDNGADSGTVYARQSAELTEVSAAGRSPCIGKRPYAFPFRGRAQPLPPCRRARGGTIDVALVKGGSNGLKVYNPAPRCGQYNGTNCLPSAYNGGKANVTRYDLSAGRIPVVDSFENPIAYLRRERRGCFTVLRRDGVTEKETTTPTGALGSCATSQRIYVRIEVQGKQCMRTSQLEDDYVMIALNRTRSGPSFASEGLRALVPKSAVPALTARERDRIDDAYLGCGIRPKRLRGIDRDLKVEDTFRAFGSEVDRYISPEAFRDCGEEPGCGAPYANYQGFCYFNDVALLAASTTGVSAVGSGTSGRRRLGPSGIARAVVPRESRSEFQVFDSIAYADPNVPEGQGHLATWIYGAANPNGDRTHKMFGWTPVRSPKDPPPAC